MQWITDVTRENICDIINNSPMLLISAMKIFSKNERNINFELLLVDYYNTLMTRKNLQTLDEDDKKLLELINNNKVEDLLYLISNFDFVKNMFISTVNFENLSILDKHQIIKIANQEKENNDLTSRPLYKLNYIASNLSHNEQDLLQYYKDYINMNGNYITNHDTARDIIFNHLKEIKENDFESYKVIVSNAIAIYYKWGKYNLSKYKKDVETSSRMFIRRIKLLNIEDLITLTQTDDYFLNDIITQYLYFKFLPQDITDEAEKFCEKKLSKKMKKKINDIQKTTEN